MFDKLKYFYYDIKNGIKNLIKWFPVVWSDDNYDYLSIYNVLYFKLKEMEKFFNSDETWTRDAKNVAKEIKIARLVCERIINGNYLENALIPYYKKYSGENYMTFAPCKDNPRFYEVKLTDNLDEIKLKNRCYKHSDYMEKQDIEYFWDYIKKHHKKWWC